MLGIYPGRPEFFKKYEFWTKHKARCGKLYPYKPDLYIERFIILNCMHKYKRTKQYRKLYGLMHSHKDLLK